jgi:uncharacterized protein (TIGR03083 family)
MSGAWKSAGRARRDFADLAAELDDEQWAAKTLCPGWTPQHVLGHLVWHIELTIPSLLGAMARSRFDFEKATDRAASELAKRPTQELLSTLRDQADKQSSIPGVAETGLVTDTAIHTQDVRRACGLPGTLSAESVLIALHFLTTHKNAKYVMDPKTKDGLRLAATDVDWSFGSGALVEGPGEAIIMSLAGRPALSELAGEGLETLTTRLAG